MILSRDRPTVLRPRLAPMLARVSVGDSRSQLSRYHVTGGPYEWRLLKYWRNNILHLYRILVKTDTDLYSTNIISEHEHDKIKQLETSCEAGCIIVSMGRGSYTVRYWWYIAED